MLNNNESSRHILSVVSISMAILLALSAMPWGNLTGNILKDFNLFGDLFPDNDNALSTITSDIVDPELEELIAATDGNSTGADNASNNTNPTAMPDSSTVDSSYASVKYIEEAPVIDGSVAIENYTSGTPLPLFRKALAEVGRRNVRIAVVGDSYIEGDIFCSHLRDILQQRHGGSGVGFIAAHNDFPGFRQTVAHKSSGWTMHDIRNMKRSDSLRTLSGDYGKSSGIASSTYDGRAKFPTTREWYRSTFIFIAPDSGVVKINGSYGASTEQHIMPSPDPQAVILEGATKTTNIEINIPGAISLGTYLDSSTGIQLDCMSIRGNSGLNLSRINHDLTSKTSQWIDYDLIIVEFGMNVLSAEQTDYTSYMKGMIKSINHLRECYPNADIIIMGVGDRGVKVGPDVQSLHTVAAMVHAQRELAHRTASHFWDTRAAMGGDKAVVDWRKRKLLNADYIHLNHDGGAELARLFDIALTHALNE